MSRLDALTRSRCLLQDSSWWQRAYITGIAYLYLQPETVDDLLSIGVSLVQNIGDGNRLAVVGVQVDAKAEAQSQRNDYESHCREVSPEIGTFELA